jgi:hypothetical protein
VGTAPLVKFNQHQTKIDHDDIDIYIESDVKSLDSRRQTVDQNRFSMHPIIKKADSTKYSKEALSANKAGRDGKTPERKDSFRRTPPDTESKMHY